MKRSSFTVIGAVKAENASRDNGYKQIVQCELRLHWPPNATEEQVTRVLEQVVRETMRRYRKQQQKGEMDG